MMASLAKPKRIVKGKVVISKRHLLELSKDPMVVNLSVLELGL